MQQGLPKFVNQMVKQDIRLKGIIDDIAKGISGYDNFKFRLSRRYFMNWGIDFVDFINAKSRHTYNISIKIEDYGTAFIFNCEIKEFYKENRRV